MSWYSYLLASWLWVPLLGLWLVLRGTERRALLIAMVAAALVAGYEATIPRSANIRIDLLVVIPVLGAIHGVCGSILATQVLRLRKQRLPGFWARGLAALLCLGAAAAIAVAMIVDGARMSGQTKAHDDGSRFAFEAAFRDEGTQRRVFGNLEGGWAGYYRAEAALPAFAHLIIDDTGRLWLFSPSYYEQRGIGKPDPSDPKVFAAVLKDNYGGESGKLTLTREAQDRLTMNVTRYGNTNRVTYNRAPAPRFPRPAQPTDPVKYLGVFSGRALESDKHLYVAQLWLWESDGRLWGKYLWQGFTRGTNQWVVAQRDAKIDCEDSSCRRFVVRAGDEMPVTMERAPDGDLIVTSSNPKVTLKPGETVTGFLFDLAPLASADENRYWLRAVHRDVFWQVP